MPILIAKLVSLDNRIRL